MAGDPGAGVPLAATATSTVPPIVRRSAPWLWGAVVATWLCRPYFALAPGEMFLNHEMYSYVHRVIEFLDLLRAGYAFPQWAIDFRGGLGSPYFGYYQPGFFYAASALAAVLPTLTAIATTLWLLALAGYGGIFAFVRARFGTAAGVLAATTFLASPYLRTDLYVRGDLSEFTGMMLLPVAIHFLTAWLDGRGVACWWAFTASAAAIVCAHPVAGLLGYGTFVVTIACWTVLGGHRVRAGAAVGALVAAVGLAAFYLGPIALEWNLVEADQLTMKSSDFRLHFADPLEMLGLRARSGFVLAQLSLGRGVLALAALGAAVSLGSWATLSASARRVVLTLLTLLAATAWLTNESSQPVWEAFPLLPFLQFPWRFFIVITIALAALSGCLVRGTTAALLAGVAFHAWNVGGLHTFPVKTGLLHPPTARGLVAEFVAPDVADEWLPRGAAHFRRDARPLAATCSGVCRVGELERAAGFLRAQVLTLGPSEVVLPHYFFPVGWHATLDGRPFRSPGRRPGSCT